MRALPTGASVLLLVCTALAEPKPVSSTVATPASISSNAFLIRHGQVHTVGALGTIANGDVLIANGKIAAVGTNLTAPQGATIIDVQGKPVTPGLMASYTQLGIDEIELVSEA